MKNDEKISNFEGMKKVQTNSKYLGLFLKKIEDFLSYLG